MWRTPFDACSTASARPWIARSSAPGKTLAPAGARFQNGNERTVDESPDKSVTKGPLLRVVRIGYNGPIDPNAPALPDHNSTLGLPENPNPPDRLLSPWFGVPLKQ